MLLRIAMAAAVLGWLSAAPVEACSCMQPGPPCNAYAQAHAVFSGRVNDIRQRAHTREEGYELWQRRVFFEVIEGFRGVEGKTVEVLTGQGGGDCGYGFAPWQEYLVYAYKDAMSGRLSTSICSRTRSLGRAGEDLNYLRQRDRPEMAAGFRLSAMRLKRDRNGDTSFDGHPAGLQVTLEGPSGKRSGATGSEGTLEIWGLVPGEHRVSVAAPAGYIVSVLPENVTVPARGCAGVQVMLTPPPRR